MRYVADACALINLAATGRVELLLDAMDAHLLVTDLAFAEVRFLDGPLDEETGQPTREPIDLSRLVSRGRLEVCALGSPHDVLFVRAAERLLDEDASCATLAGTTGLPLMTDDAKLRRVAQSLVPEIQLVGSLTFIRTAVVTAGLDDHTAVDVVRDLRHKACFLPPRNAPAEDREWFMELLERAG